MGPVPPSGRSQSLCWGWCNLCSSGSSLRGQPVYNHPGGPLFIVKVLVDQPYPEPRQQIAVLRATYKMAHKARLHPPVEHQRRVQVPVQAVGTGGGVLLPYLQAQSIHRFPDIVRDGRGAAEHLTGWHLLTLLQHGR